MPGRQPPGSIFPFDSFETIAFEVTVPADGSIVIEVIHTYGYRGGSCVTCYPDCDQSTGIGVLDIFDFLCFQNSFVLGEPYA